MTHDDHTYNNVFKRGSDGTTLYFPWLRFGRGYVIPSNVPYERLVSGHRLMIKTVTILAILSGALARQCVVAFTHSFWLSIFVLVCVVFLAFTACQSLWIRAQFHGERLRKIDP
jgi:hypothetical protein